MENLTAEDQETIIKYRWANLWRTLFACFCGLLVSAHWFSCQTISFQHYFQFFLFYQDIETDETQPATDINLQSAIPSILLQNTSFHGSNNNISDLSSTQLRIYVAFEYKELLFIMIKFENSFLQIPLCKSNCLLLYLLCWLGNWPLFLLSYSENFQK